MRISRQVDLTIDNNIPCQIILIVSIVCSSCVIPFHENGVRSCKTQDQVRANRVVSSLAMKNQSCSVFQRYGTSRTPIKGRTVSYLNRAFLHHKITIIGSRQGQCARTRLRYSSGSGNVVGQGNIGWSRQANGGSGLRIEVKDRVCHRT